MRQGVLAAAILFLLAAPLKAETLRMANGSEIKGTLVSTDADSYLIAQDNGTVRVPKADVAAVQSDFYVVLKDGSVLAGNVKDVSTTSISLQTEQGLRQINRELVVKLSTAPVNVAPPPPPPAPEPEVKLSTSAAQQEAAVSTSTAVAAVAAAPILPPAAQTLAPAATAPPAATPATTAPATAAQPAATTQPPQAAPKTEATVAKPRPALARKEQPTDGKPKARNWRMSAQLGIWKPGYKITSADTNNETLSINNVGIAFGGRLMRVLGKGDWQLGADISMLSLSTKDHGTAVSTVKVSGERLSLLALAARRALTFGNGYNLYALGGFGLAKTKLNYNVTPNASVTSTGHTVSESKLQLAAGAEVQKDVDGTLLALGVTLYNSGTGNEILSGSSSLTAALGARMIWSF